MARTRYVIPRPQSLLVSSLRRPRLTKGWNEKPKSSPAFARTLERTKRGYQPSFYGEISPTAGSSPSLSDLGYKVENEHAPPGTPMDQGFIEYKSHDEELGVQEEGIPEEAGRALNAPPFQERTELLVCHPQMTRQNHHRTEQAAAEVANLSRTAQELRSKFDHSYVGHYPTKKSRDGHVKHVEDLGKRADKYQRKANGRRKYGYP